MKHECLPLGGVAEGRGGLSPPLGEMSTGQRGYNTPVISTSDEGARRNLPGKYRTLCPGRFLPDW